VARIDSYSPSPPAGQVLDRQACHHSFFVSEAGALEETARFATSVIAQRRQEC
jgi:hypothetical protein